MKNRIPLSLISLVAAMIFSVSLVAQETTEVTVQVKKDGKVVKDTTYQFEDDEGAKHAVKMMEVLSGDDEHMMTYSYSMKHKDGDEARSMVFISEDGKKVGIKEFDADSLVWVSEGEEGNVKVIKKKLGEGEHIHGEHVIVMKKGDGETFDILVDKDIDTGDGEHKVVKVTVTEGEKGSWHVDSEELKDIDKDVYFISEDDDVKMEVKKIVEEHDGDEVEIVVIKKKSDKEGDEEKEGKEITKEVKVEKKVKKKPSEQ